MRFEGSEIHNCFNFIFCEENFTTFYNEETTNSRMKNLVFRSYNRKFIKLKGNGQIIGLNEDNALNSMKQNRTMIPKLFEEFNGSILSFYFLYYIHEK